MITVTITSELSDRLEAFREAFQAKHQVRPSKQEALRIVLSWVLLGPSLLEALTDGQL